MRKRKRRKVTSLKLNRDRTPILSSQGLEDFLEREIALYCAFTTSVARFCLSCACEDEDSPFELDVENGDLSSEAAFRLMHRAGLEFEVFKRNHADIFASAAYLARYACQQKEWEQEFPEKRKAFFDDFMGALPPPIPKSSGLSDKERLEVWFTGTQATEEERLSLAYLSVFIESGELLEKLKAKFKNMTDQDLLLAWISLMDGQLYPKRQRFETL